MNTFKFKDGIEPGDVQVMSPKLIVAFGWFTYFAEQRGLPVVVTNIKNKFDISISNTHPEGRAIDIATRSVGYTDEDIETLELQMRLQCEELGAISKRTGQPRIALHHDGGLGPHFHIQVRP